MGECQCKQGFDKQDDGVRFLCEIVGTFFPPYQALDLRNEMKNCFLSNFRSNISLALQLFIF